MKEKVVLAYSGGLDTTAIIPWLKENFDYEVICVCVNCGQCITACPVGALTEKDAIADVWDALADGTKHVVVQPAPAVRAALGEEFSMPIGTSGRGMVMLSGGIDSPVSCYSMAKRGLKLDMLHFHSYPYTSEMAKEKVKHLAEILRPYTGPVTLICAPLTKIQELIHAKCNTQYMITLVRVFMMRIAEKIALERKCGCIVNGESLGQVASQTLESITVTNAQIKKLPVFRPLIGSNKEEIIDISQKIGAFETSIQPYEDCCTVFLPDAPVTRPKMKNVEFEMSKLGDVQSLIDECVANIEIVEIV